MNARDLLEPFKFHREWAGYSVPPGRAACALELARAETLLRRAIDLDAATVEWVDDPQPYDPGDFVTPEEAAGYFESGSWHGPYGVIVTVEAVCPTCGQPLAERAEASLWGIVVGRDDERDPYRRVVEAELADELVEQLAAAVARAEANR